MEDEKGARRDAATIPGEIEGLAEEQGRLAATLALAGALLESARAGDEKNTAAIVAAKREMGEYTAHAMANLYTDDGFQELAEAAQYVGQINSQIALRQENAGRIIMLEKMLQSPYFARIDFLFEGDDAAEKMYIGRSTLKKPETNEIVVYDWRAPVAGLFYRFSPGKAHYDAPAGRIEGELLLKRQYEIRAGKLEYFFDADVEIVDEFLRQFLSRNASARMKTIVETIQRDQDAVIRDNENDLLMVQGAAGSGKTSIGLHRVAWLMYQGLANRLAADNIVILSPNTLFERYISNILPELGEQNAVSLTVEKILDKILGGRDIQSKNQLMEIITANEDEEECRLMKDCLEFKTGFPFLEILERFIRILPSRFIDFRDIDYAGRRIAARQELQNRIVNGKRGLSLAVSLRQTETAILDRVHGLRKERLKKLSRFVKRYNYSPPEGEAAVRLLSILESTALIKEIRKFTKLDYLGLYRRLIGDKACFYSLAKGIPLPDNIGEILDYTINNLKGGPLRHEDALALSYLTLRLGGYRFMENIRQVVLDEAQDYYPLHYMLYGGLFPKARYTVLGDMNQTIGREVDVAFYEQIRRILNKEKSTLVVMNKSFRCTSEILRFSAGFLEGGEDMESFSRHGEEPSVHTAPDEDRLAEMIMDEAALCRDKGCKSIGLITKTAAAASRWQGKLEGMYLAEESREEELTGTFIIPVYLTKGLEFDAVLILDADQTHYHSREDRKLLYIASSRALHRLALFHTGEASPWLKQNIERGRG